VSRFRDLVGIAIGGILARKARTLLIMLGPVVGVAAMVGAVGLTESAKGDLKARLDELGTTLITAEAGSAFGRQNPTLPTDSVRRVRAIPAVVRASAVAEVPGVVTLPSEGGADYFETFPVPVLAADSRLPAVLEVPVRSGRWLDRADRVNRTRAVVLGGGLADEFGVIPGEVRTLRLNGIDYHGTTVAIRIAAVGQQDNIGFGAVIKGIKAQIGLLPMDAIVGFGIADHTAVGAFVSQMTGKGLIPKLVTPTHWVMVDTAPANRHFPWSLTSPNHRIGGVTGQRL